MPCRQPRAPTIGLSLALLLAPAACTERLIRERICGDGRASPGEICLGEGERRSLRVPTLSALSIRVAQFDGEAGPDLMVMGLGAASGVVEGRLFLGDGAGGFFDPIDPGVGGCSAHPVPGSIDDDGIDDLLVDDCATTVSLFRGTPSGVFEPPLTVVTGAQTSSSGLLDLDADGRREVVLFGAVEPDSPVLSVAEREPDGAFAPPVLSPLSGPTDDFVPDSFGILRSGEDAPPDALLVDADRPEGLAIARGEPGLRFSPPELVSPPGLRPGWATPRDLDGDGRDEVLAASFEDEALVVLDADAQALVERARTRVPGLGPGLVALADLDADGYLDLLRVEAGPAQLHAWRGQPGGRFIGPTPIDLDTPADQLALADLDADGVLDLVVGSFEQSTIHVLLSDP